MNKNKEINTKINDWTIISDPIIVDGKKNRKLRCKCGREVMFSESYINKSIFSKSCRSCSQIKRRNTDGKRVYNVGDVIMNLEILNIHSGKSVSYTVKCIECNNTYHTGHSILNRKSKGIGLGKCHNCYTPDMKSKKKHLMLTKNISFTHYNKIQRQVELRGIEFDVSPEYLEKMYTGVCHFSGIEINIGTYSVLNGGKDLGNASLDRLDSTIGYVENNVVWVYKPVNIMKHIMSSDEFLDLCEKIVLNNQQKKNSVKSLGYEYVLILDENNTL